MATVPRPWSQEEDNLLKQAVATHGEEPGVWKIIASTIPGRSNKACRKVWYAQSWLIILLPLMAELYIRDGFILFLRLLER